MIDVLIYLFESYLQGSLKPNQSNLTSKLAEAGYEPAAISQAFDWLENIKQADLDEIEGRLASSTSVMRIYTTDEMEWKSLISQLVGFY